MFLLGVTNLYLHITSRYLLYKIILGITELSICKWLTIKGGYSADTLWKIKRRLARKYECRFVVSVG